MVSWVGVVGIVSGGGVFGSMDIMLVCGLLRHWGSVRSSSSDDVLLWDLPPDRLNSSTSSRGGSSLMFSQSRVVVSLSSLAS